MRQRLFLVLFLATTSCAGIATKPPKLVTCILDPPLAALECHDPIENKDYPLDISFAGQYTCFPIESMQELLTWIKLVAQ